MLKYPKLYKQSQNAEIYNTKVRSNSRYFTKIRAEKRLVLVESVPVLKSNGVLLPQLTYMTAIARSSQLGSWRMKEQQLCELVLRLDCLVFDQEYAKYSHVSASL